MTLKELIERTKHRLSRYSLTELLLGIWFSRKLTKHGIIVVTGGRPLPRVINEGGEIFTENCQFYSGVRLEIGNGATLTIGNGTYLNRNTIIHASHDVRIGKDCRISWDVVIMDDDGHSIPGLVNNKPVIIEDDVWIGCRTIILKGVRVGKGAVIAAGSVVTRRVPPGTVVGGVPAQVLFTLAPKSPEHSNKL